MRRTIWLWGLLALFGGGAVAGEANPAIRDREFVYESAPFPSCHASTIAETPQGLVAAWFGGTAESHPDVTIWLSRRGAAGWTAPQEVGTGIQYRHPDGTPFRYPCWNPVLFQRPNGPLLLFFKVGPRPSTWWGMLTESRDHGVTWSPAVRLPEGIAGPVKNKPILLSDGTLLCPSSSEHDGWRVHFEMLSFSPESRNWTRVGPIEQPETFSTIQPSVLRQADGALQAIGRSRNGKLYTTTSTDQGRSWSAMQLTNLPNPNAGTDAVTLADGRHVLVYNHTAKGRTPLNVAVSANGSDWQAAAVLESEPGEYSYPAVIQSRDGLIHVTYTWKRERVRHVTLDPAKFQPKPIMEGAWPADVP